MQRIFAGKKYCFVPPYRGRFWALTVPRLFPYYLRKTASIHSIRFAGVERLEQSFHDGHRIVLSSNHSRYTDPMLLAAMSSRIGAPFFYLTNWHAFLESKAQAWILRRLGGFSINREGVDRRALLTSSELLAEGDRPLVIFPEGEVSRTNDSLAPFMRGLSFIVNNAAQKLQGRSKIVIHPVAIQYRLTEWDEAPLHAALDEIETSFGWRKSRASLIKRIVAIGKNLLASKEAEFLGSIQYGEICSRADRLKDWILETLEQEWGAGKKESRCFMSRVNSLRSAILRRFLESLENRSRAKTALSKIEFAVRLSNYPKDYLARDFSIEKMTETVQRLREDALNSAAVLGKWSASLEVGEAIETNNGAEIGVLRDSVSERIMSMLRRQVTA